MRRYVLFAAAVAPLLVAAAVTVPGCGEEFENICAFLRDQNSCYATFHDDIDDRCGAPGAGNGPKGSFATRETLDVCFLEGGGQVVFDPPLDIAAFPPTSVSFKRIDAQAQECGSFTYAGEFTYSVTINPCGEPENAGGTGGTGGSAMLPQCDDGSGNEGGGNAGSGGSGAGGSGGGSSTEILSVHGGTVSITTPEGRDILDVSCADGTSHHFNRIDAAERECGGFDQLLPRAVLESSAGLQPPPKADLTDEAEVEKYAGFISFRVHYPPIDPSTDSEGIVKDTPAEVVEYFNCVIPPAAPLCFNGEKDGLETDIDCGGTLCDRDCGDGQSCVTEDDCTSRRCDVDPSTGFKTCQAAEGEGGAGGTDGTGGAGGTDGAGGAGGAGGQ
ncbi:hypothetical protein [Sorangium sp. So ce341]|uniref:hypothetical protein n=1 Tax=Sorangium sp. So ce341 TaxID=3133302 RepID=UPI003F61D3D6